MKKYLFWFLLIIISTKTFAQNDETIASILQPVPRNYEVKQAVEVESLVPMFLYGGYHFAVGYRYKKFRVRLSVINGGTYNAETAGFNTTPGFKRFYQTSPGIFLGYNVWKNLEVYTYLESHTFRIKQNSTGNTKDIGSYDTGLAVSYQFFIGRYFYIQPGLHLYLRKSNSADFEGAKYNIPNADGSVVLRLGVRLWKQYQ
jgi:hypothetical protein